MIQPVTLLLPASAMKFVGETMLGSSTEMNTLVYLVLSTVKNDV